MSFSPSFYPFLFQSTPPAREATGPGPPWSRSRSDFNPRLPRGRRRILSKKGWRGIIFQSTPPAREATIHFIPKIPRLIISIHASREGGDYVVMAAGQDGIEFQSTPPAREATGTAPRSARWRSNFNPRLPRGRRPGYIKSLPRLIAISIHASREGGDARQT